MKIIFSGGPLDGETREVEETEKITIPKRGTAPVEPALSVADEATYKRVARAYVGDAALFVYVKGSE